MTRDSGHRNTKADAGRVSRRGTMQRFALHAVDTLGLVRAMLLRVQAMFLPGARLVPEMNRLMAAHNLLGRAERFSNHRTEVTSSVGHHKDKDVEVA